MILTTKNPRHLILERVSPLQIYKYYIPGIKVKKMVHSPLRASKGLKPDKNPSFNIFLTPSGDLHYKDMGAPFTGNVFQFVQDLYNISYAEALRRIDSDLGLGVFKEGSNTVIAKSITPVEEDVQSCGVDILVRSRIFEIRDRKYWDRYGISTKDLMFYNIKPISYFYVQKEVGSGYNKIPAEPLAYATKYSGTQEIKKSIKIYQPTAKKWKHFHNCSRHVVQGFAQLAPEKKDLLIVSSIKEVLVLYKAGYNAVAPISESTTFPDYIIEFLRTHYNPVILYDNDEAGKEYAEKHSAIYGIPFVELDIPNKDLSDFVEEFSIDELRELVKTI